MTPICRYAALTALLAMLSGCAQLDQKPAGPQPQVKITSTSDATYMQPVGKSVEHVVPEPAPPGPFGDWRVHAASPGGQTTSDTGAAGSDRVAALENRVTRLENEIGALTAAHETSATRPVALNDQTGPQNGVAAPPPASVEPVSLVATTMVAPVAAATPAKTAIPASHDAPAVGKIGALRIGEHPGLTRIVLDCGERHAFHADLDNDEHILTMQVADAAWTGGKAEHAVPHSPLVSSWQAGPDGKGGTRFVLQLRRNAKLAADHFLPGARVKGARLVIDLAAG